MNPKILKKFLKVHKKDTVADGYADDKLFKQTSLTIVIVIDLMRRH
jgi:hypothetical protein